MKVLRKGNESFGCAYIGRGSAWGNPYVMGKDGDRAEVIRKFREYASAVILDKPEWLVPLKGRDLVCYCAPLACHGDVLLEMVEESEMENKNKLICCTCFKTGMVFSKRDFFCDECVKNGIV